MTGDSIGATVDTVANFTVASDVLQADRSELVGSVTNLNIAGDGATAIGATIAASAAVFTSVTGAYDLGTDATTTIVVASYATAFTTSTLATALSSGGNLALTANGAWSGTESFLCLYDDNANTYLAVVTPGATLDNAALASASVTNLIQLTGITDATTVTNADFQLVA